MATSAIWNVTYLAACRTTLVPIFTSFSRHVVSNRCRILAGTANLLTTFVRSYSTGNSWSGTLLSPQS